MSTDQVQALEWKLRRLPLVVPSLTPRGLFASASLAAVFLGTLALTVEASLVRTKFVAASTLTESYPIWVRGPLKAPVSSILSSLGLAGLTPVRYTLLFGGMAVCYLAVLFLADKVSLRWALITVGACQVLVFLGPPMLSPDVYGYIAYARLDVVHGFAPYLWGPGSFPADPVYPFLQAWKSLPSPYGPLFTLASYGLAPFPVPVALWALKLAALGASLGAVGLVVVVNRKRGNNPVPGVLLMGLNPLLLEWALGGAHNDLVMMLLVVAGIYFIVSSDNRLAPASIVGAACVKASAALVFPFAFLGSHNRRRTLVWAAIAVSVIGGVILIVFGDQVFGYMRVLGTQGRMVSRESFPNVLSWLVRGGPLHGDLKPSDLSPVIRQLANVTLLGSVVGLLYKTWRGMDWITAAGWASVVLLLTTTWLLPWYIVWVLPFAALSKSRGLTYATLLVTAFIFITRIPLG
jgi:hypothetical protein